MNLSEEWCTDQILWCDELRWWLHTKQSDEMRIRLYTKQHEDIKFWNDIPNTHKTSDQIFSVIVIIFLVSLPSLDIFIKDILQSELCFKPVRIQFICWVERLTVFYFLFSLFFSCQIPELTSSSNYCPSRSLGSWFYSCNTCKKYFNMWL